MRRVTLDKLPVSDDTRKLLESNNSIAGAVVSGNTVHVFGPELATKTLAAARAWAKSPSHFWERDWKPAKPKPRTDGLSRTQAALKLVDEEDITPYAAAQQAGVDVSAVYRALARRERPKCQCCGRPLRAALEVGA